MSSETAKAKESVVVFRFVSCGRAYPRDLRLEQLRRNEWILTQDLRQSVSDRSIGHPDGSVYLECPD